MYFYSQTDPAWSKVKMGETACGLGRFGCTTTAICILLSKFGASLTPDKAAKKFVYTYKNPKFEDGLIVWGATDFSPLKFYKRYFTYDEQILKDWLNNPNNGAIINVINDYIPYHWVMADRFSIIGLNIVDPLGGKAFRMKTKYQPIGMALFTKK